MGVVGAFGDKIFEVSQNKIYTFDGVSISESLNVEMQEVEGGKPATYIKGFGEMNIGFDVLLLSRFCDVDAEISYWLLKMRSKTPEYLTIGKKAYGTNKHLLVSVSVGDVLIAADGTTIRAKVSLSFSEWTKAGYKKDDSDSENKSKSNKSSSKDGTTVTEKTTTSNGKTTVTTTEKTTSGNTTTTVTTKKTTDKNGKVTTSTSTQKTTKDPFDNLLTDNNK